MCNPLSVFACLAIAAGIALGDTSRAEIAQKLPSGANAVLTLDVQSILRSGYATERKWRSTLARDGYERPLMVTSGASQVTTAAAFNFNSMTPRWQASLIETPVPLKVDVLAGAKEGYADKIGGRDVFLIAPNTYFAQHSDGLVAVLWPAERQVVARWLRMDKKPLGLGPVFEEAIASKAHLSLGIDLTDVVSGAAIQKAMRNGGLSSLDKYDGNITKLSQQLATVQGLTFTANFANSIAGNMRIKFDGDVTELGPYAKGLVMEVIAETGLSSAELDSWSFSAKGNEIAGSGPVSDALLRHISTLFTPPPPPEELTSDAASPNGSKEAQRAKADASVRYYRSLVRITDGLNLKQASLHQTGVYLRTQAMAIERLPVLNVDPALQDWASRLAEAYNRAATICIDGQNQAIAMSQTALPRVADNDDDDDNDSAETRAAFREVQQQRRKTGAEARGATLDAVTKIIQEAIAPRTGVRKEMVTKYQTEF